MAENTGDLLTVPDAARLLGKPKMTLYRWAKKGKVIAVRFGGISFIPRSEVERLKKERNKETAQDN